MLLPFFGLVGLLMIGALLALGVAAKTRNSGRKRVFYITAALLLPVTSAGYLIILAELRSEYHQRRGEAFEEGSYSTLPLGHEYKLWFPYEFPNDASIGNTSLPDYADHPPLRPVQQVAISGDWVFGGVGKNDSLKDRVDFYFSMNLSTGEIRRFANEAGLRAHSPAFGPLAGPEYVFEAAQARQESPYFWPVAGGVPIAFIFAGLVFLLHTNSKKPAEIPAGF